jgi:hypothetical protein
MTAHYHEIDESAGSCEQAARVCILVNLLSRLLLALLFAAAYVIVRYCF